MRFVSGILALLLTPPGLPSGGFHWQRTITPPAGAGLSQACFVLDAQTFANAAPALRDLRLFQDGVELPYAVEESYDPRALETGTTTSDDRSLYETSLVADLQPRLLAMAPGDGVVRDSRTHQPLKPGQIDSWAGVYDELEIPAHVPVERIRLEPAPETGATVNISATETGSSLYPAPRETLQGSVDKQHPALPFTLGANLQHRAKVSIVVEHTDQVFRRAIFEMRRRSLCYQPRSASPLTLYLGGGEAMTAKTYSYASNFSTAVDRPYAMVGPLVPNPDLESTTVKAGLLTQRKRLWLAAAFAIAFFGVAARGMLRSTKSPA